MVWCIPLTIPWNWRNSLWKLGYYIGLNGCSLRTEESLNVVSKLPLNKILLETDCPYCEVRKTHPGYQHIQTHFPAKAEKKFEEGYLVKSRQEPCHIVQIAEIIASLHETSVEEVATATFQNSMDLFGFSKKRRVNAQWG